MGQDRFLEQLARNWGMTHSHANSFDIDIKKLRNTRIGIRGGI